MIHITWEFFSCLFEKTLQCNSTPKTMAWWICDGSRIIITYLLPCMPFGAKSCDKAPPLLSNVPFSRWLPSYNLGCSARFRLSSSKFVTLKSQKVACFFVRCFTPQKTPATLAEHSCSNLRAQTDFRLLWHAAKTTGKVRFSSQAQRLKWPL